MTAATGLDDEPEPVNWGRVVGFLLALPVYFAVFLFWPAGTWTWATGWLFILAFVGTLGVAAGILWRVNPAVLAARTSSPEGTKWWDKILLGVLFPAVYAIIPVAALDDGRFHWLSLPWWVCGIGYVLFLAGMGLVTWAEAVNKFFEVTVRIQAERGQRVIDTGPYAVVRHPGYVAGILLCVATALCLGAVWAMIPAGVAAAVLVVRTRREDQTLQAELAGYRDYTQRVRSKLLPGVW